MNKSIVFIVLAVLVIGSAIIFSQKRLEKSTSDKSSIVVSESPTKPTEKVDYQASFAIFTNGTFRIFTDSKYHNQSEDVFLEPNNPNVVNVKKSNITWDDFFKTLPFKLTKDCLTTGTGQIFCNPSAGSGQARLKFYLNGKEDPNALDKQIVDGDRLLVTYGNENEQQIKNQLDNLKGFAK